MSPTPGHAPELLRQMTRVRRLEERCAELYADGRIRGFLHLYIGEEAVATGVLHNLERGDAVVATYREHGHALLWGLSARSILAEMMGKVTGCSRGRGGSMHLFDRQARFYGGHAIVGGGLPVAVGLALADRVRGTGAVVACFFGDGAVAEGAFHESMNLAALWRLPVLFCCENNLYAMGTALHRHQAQIDLAAKAASYSMAAAAVDGMDVLAVDAAAREAVAAVRADGRPRFLELRTYRFKPHSAFDAELYRTKEEVRAWEARCSIDNLRRRLLDDGTLTPEQLAAMEAEIAAELDDAAAAAAADPVEPVEELTRFVTSEASSS